MIYKEDYSSFLDTFHAWSSHVQEHFENRPSAPDSDGVSEMASENLVAGGFSSFCDELRDSRLRAFILSKDDCLNRIDNEVFTNCHPSDLFAEVLEIEVEGVWLEEMNSYVLSNATEGTENFEIFRMPTLRDHSFYYLDPHFSVIDCTGYRTVNSRITSVFDFEEFKAMELLLDSHDPDTPVRDVLENAADYAKLTHYRDLMEWRIPFHLFNKKSPFENFEGASINFSDEETKSFLKRFYPLDIESIYSTIADETDATRVAREHMERNPKLQIRKDDFISKFCPKISRNGGLRVWSTLTKEYPHLSKRGPKS